MTLVLSASIGSAFTVMTSDERIAFSNSDGSLTPIYDEKVIKAYQLTDKVFFGWGGDQYTSEGILEMLKKEVKPDDDLEACKLIIDELEAERNVAVLLSGFYQDGTSGMVMFRTNEGIMEYKQDNLEYKYAIFPPVGDYTDMQADLLHVEDFTQMSIINEFPKLGYAKWLNKSIETAINHLIQVQGLISYQQPELVTSEGCYLVHYKDAEGKLQTLTGEYDSAIVHDQLRDAEMDQAL